MSPRHARSWPDRHLWESEWETLQPLVRDDSDAALPALDGLLERMLVEQGYPLEEEEIERVAEEGIDPEALASFHAARDITRRVDRGMDVDPAGVGQAVGLYRALHDHLLTRRADAD